MILHHLDRKGGFTCGDTESGITSYAYPGSVNATAAKRNPEAIAARMILHETECRATHLTMNGQPNTIAYDARNMGILAK